MKRNESNIITQIPGCKPGRISRHKLKEALDESS